MRLHAPLVETRPQFYFSVVSITHCPQDNSMGLIGSLPPLVTCMMDSSTFPLNKWSLAFFFSLMLNDTFVCMLLGLVSGLMT